MHKAMQGYIRAIDRMNHVIGRIAMYLIFVLMGVLLWSSVSKTFLTPSARSWRSSNNTTPTWRRRAGLTATPEQAKPRQ